MATEYRKEFFDREYSAKEAYSSVLKYAGASLKRDAVDVRVVSEVENGTPSSKGGKNGIIDSQTQVGGWPIYTGTALSDADKDGIYQVTYTNVPAGSYAFKVVGSVESWMGGDYLDFDNSSMGVKEEDKLYDGDGNIMFTLNQAADVTIQYNIYTGKIIVTTPSGSFGKPKLEYFHIASGNHDQCKDEDAFTEANNYTLTFQKGVMVNENGNAEVGCFILGNCDYTVYRKYFSTTVTESGTYNVTVTFNGDYENPDFTVTAVKVESADAIPVYIMGGFNNWKANEDYKLTSTDGNYYVATYPAGSELKIEGGFKLGSADNWESIDLGAAYPDMQSNG